MTLLVAIIAFLGVVASGLLWISAVLAVVSKLLAVVALHICLIMGFSSSRTASFILLFGLLPLIIIVGQAPFSILL